MGVLMTLTLGLSSLVIREIGQTASIVRAGQAYYNAEAGIENALLELQNSLPGYETKITGDKYDFIPGSYIADDGSVDFQYQVRNQGDRYPYFDEDFPVFVGPEMGVPKLALYKDYPEKTYNVLPLNQTVSIPLFVDCGQGKVRDVKDFLLEYFVDFNVDPDIMSNLIGGEYGNIKLSKFDILRWKLYGEPMDTPGKTDAISDFYPAHENNSANSPVCIGTDLSIENQANTHCIIPVAQEILEQKVVIRRLSSDQIVLNNDFPSFKIISPADSPQLGPDDIKYPEIVSDAPIFDSWSMARECYKNEAGFDVTGSADIKKGCTIKNFVNSHTKNYFTLTNVINPGIIGVSNPNLRNSKANIYYRLVAKGSTACRKPAQFILAAPTTKIPVASKAKSDSTLTPLPREYAEISADGFAAGGSVKQSIDVRLKLNSFLPVFNFSLYRTNVGVVTAGQ